MTGRYGVFRKRTGEGWNAELRNDFCIGWIPEPELRKDFCIGCILEPNPGPHGSILYMVWVAAACGITAHRTYTVPINLMICVELIALSIKTIEPHGFGNGQLSTKEVRNYL